MSSTQYELVRQPGRRWPIPEPLRFYGFPDEVAAYYKNSAFAADLMLELEKLLKSIYYLGPLRGYPQRLYQWSGEVPDHVGERGDRAIEAILAGAERTFNLKPKQKTLELPALVARRLREMGLIHDFQLKRLVPDRGSGTPPDHAAALAVAVAVLILAV